MRKPERVVSNIVFLLPYQRFLYVCGDDIAARSALRCQAHHGPCDSVNCVVTQATNAEDKLELQGKEESIIVDVKVHVSAESVRTFKVCGGLLEGRDSVAIRNCINEVAHSY